MSKQSNSVSKKSIPLAKIVCIVLVVLSLAFGGFYFYKYQDVNNKYIEATKSQEDRNKETVAKVSKLYNIPEYDKEEPLIVVVKDKDQLTGSEFAKKYFDKAQNDDVIIAYKDSDISLIYREKDNKIIKTDNYSNFLAAANPVNVAIIAPNSSQQSLQDKLISSYDVIKVVAKSEPKSSITVGTVVDVKGDATDASSKLAALLGYTIGNLPAGETAPEGASFVIIAPSVIQ